MEQLSTLRLLEIIKERNEENYKLFKVRQKELLLKLKNKNYSNDTINEELTNLLKNADNVFLKLMNLEG